MSVHAYKWPHKRREGEERGYGFREFVSFPGKRTDKKFQDLEIGSINFNKSECLDLVSYFKMKALCEGNIHLECNKSKSDARKTISLGSTKIPGSLMTPTPSGKQEIQPSAKFTHLTSSCSE